MCRLLPGCAPVAPYPTIGGLPAPRAHVMVATGLPDSHIGTPSDPFASHAGVAQHGTLQTAAGGYGRSA